MVKLSPQTRVKLHEAIKGRWQGPNGKGSTRVKVMDGKVRWKSSFEEMMKKSKGWTTKCKAKV